MSLTDYIHFIYFFKLLNLRFLIKLAFFISLLYGPLFFHKNNNNNNNNNKYKLLLLLLLSLFSLLVLSFLSLPCIVLYIHVIVHAALIAMLNSCHIYYI